ncbi:MAG: hypothetical protein U0271_22325 [Polyangiaceae bacterium]
MFKKFGVALSALVFAACAGSSSSSSSKPESSAASSAEPSSSDSARSTGEPATNPSSSSTPREPVKVTCGDKGVDGQAAFDRAKPLLKKLHAEEHLTEAEMSTMLRELETAASANLIDAQYAFGATVFGVLFGDHAPEASERTRYVTAFRFLRVAARKAQPNAVQGFPALAKDHVPATLEQPLTDVPREWIDAGVAEGDAWLKQCM